MLRLGTDSLLTQNFILFRPQQTGRGHHTGAGQWPTHLKHDMDTPRVTVDMSGCPMTPSKGHMK